MGRSLKNKKSGKNTRVIACKKGATTLSKKRVTYDLVQDVVTTIFDNAWSVIMENQNELTDNKDKEEYDFEWGSLEEYDRVMQEKFHVELDTMNENLIGGYRIVHPRYMLGKSMQVQSNHSKICTDGVLMYHKDVRRGLVCKYTYKCNVCSKEAIFYTEDPKNPQLNKAAVWGTLSTGSTFAHLEEQLSVMDIPPISRRMFFQIQRSLGSLWKNSLWEIMEAAGKEEYSQAVNKKNVDKDGIPFITVYLDGGWSKRSYGHNYNAASGVAVVIGKETGKLLFIGVRNKFCSVCCRSEYKSESVKEHMCFKNWSGSSSAMESDIIVEAFNTSISMHNLRYKTFIADGDSTVFSQIKKKVSYGLQIKKIECTNHCIKNYGKHLYKIKADTKCVAEPIRKLLTKDIIEQLTKSAQNAIYDNALGNPENLKLDIKNSVAHVFGDHTNCKQHICDKVGDVSHNRIDVLRSTGAHHHVYSALDSVLLKSNMLIDNETTNRAELFMSLLARFNMGKRLNLIQRDSFQIRSYLSALRYNEGHLWHAKSWKSAFTKSPGQNVKSYMRRMTNLSLKRKARRNVSLESPRKKLKFDNSKKSIPVESMDYGSNIAEIELDGLELQNAVQAKINDLRVSKEEADLIEAETVEQFKDSSGRYTTERMFRLTASKFGAVFRRQLTTPCHALVKEILQHNRNSTTVAIDYGRQYESVAISKFEETFSKKVRKCGLFIDLETGYLGASPDGIIDEDNLVEVKCLYSVYKKNLNLRDAVEKKLVPCLKINQENKIELKKNHDYFFQIQGQLHIAGRKQCYFIVYSGDHNDIFVEKIKKDDDIWRQMFTKLKFFYEECIGPEIILNRIRRKLKCRDPPIILDHIKQKQLEKEKKNKKV